MDTGKGQVQDSMSEDERRRLFMLVRRNNGRYVLYMIDAIRLFREKVAFESLSPLVFFRRHVLPNCACAFAFIEPNFYVVGENKHDVYAFNKKDILNLKPLEKRRGSEFLVTLPPMICIKSEPLAFSYNGNLYVIAKTGSPEPQEFNQFEYYSPLKGIWTDLWPKPLWRSSIKSHIILEDMVYFSLTTQTVMSFNLKTSRWSTVFDPYAQLYDQKSFYPRYSQPFPPTFDSQIELFGDTFFGGVVRGQHLDIFASQKCLPYEKHFLRPTLNPPEDFLNALNSPEDSLATSKYFFKMDIDDGIMCVLCYTDLPSSDRSSRVVLNFFNVSNAPQQLPSSSNYTPRASSIFDAMEEENVQDVHYFNADLLSRTQLPISTRFKSTHGTLCTCLLV
ncbi:hypothetical protein AgCh_003164 [Apium graveolens]